MRISVHTYEPSACIQCFVDLQTFDLFITNAIRVSLSSTVLVLVMGCLNSETEPGKLCCVSRRDSVVLLRCTC